MANQALQSESANRFKTLKAVIKEGQAAFFVVGMALASIKNEELYKIDGHATWEDFCAKEYGWTKRYCNRLIMDTDILRALPESMQKLIQNEAAVRELAKLPKALRPAVVVAASEDGKKKVTAKTVKQNAPQVPPEKKSKSKIPPVPAPKEKPGKKSKPGPKTDGPCDLTGFAIPPAILPLWNRGIDAQENITYLRSVKLRLVKAEETKDPLYRAVNFQSAIAHIEQAISDCQMAKPYAVCPTCVGKITESCTACGGTGIVSEFFWNQCVPQEAKDVRAQLIAQPE